MNLTKDDLDTKQDVATKPELPLIEKPAPVNAAVFTPSQFDMPTVHDLANILMISGIFRLGPISGTDKQENLVNANGEVVVPVQLRRFFTVQEVQQNG